MGDHRRRLFLVWGEGSAVFAGLEGCAGLRFWVKV